MPAAGAVQREALRPDVADSADGFTAVWADNACGRGWLWHGQRVAASWTRTKVLAPTRYVTGISV